MPQWRYLLRVLTRKIWFRAALIATASVLLALASIWLAPLIPYELSLQIGAEAVDNILTILASSMLAVTTFSLTAMVTAFAGAAQNITPRATQVLIEDATAQNALSTFLGAFLFSIVSIIALQTGLYGQQGRAILLIGTILMIVGIVITLLRWIGRLTTFGRVADAIKRIERRASEALADASGGWVLSGRPDLSASEDASCVFPQRTGYVAHIDRSDLSSLFGEGDEKFRLVSREGSFVDPTVPLGWMSAHLDDEMAKKVRNCFSIRRNRDFGQDPRFGMVVLSEIASRALSPAVNDPGTAIAVLTSAQRVLDDFAEIDTDAENAHDGLVEAPIAFADMVEDLVLPIARDGAAIAEVQIHLQKMLGGLSQRIPDAESDLHKLANEALDRACKKIDSEMDRDRVLQAHARAFDGQSEKTFPSVTR